MKYMIQGRHYVSVFEKKITFYSRMAKTLPSINLYKTAGIVLTVVISIWLVYIIYKRVVIVEGFKDEVKVNTPEQSKKPFSSSNAPKYVSVIVRKGTKNTDLLKEYYFAAIKDDKYDLLLNEKDYMESSAINTYRYLSGIKVPEGLKATLFYKKGSATTETSVDFTPETPTDLLLSQSIDLRDKTTKGKLSSLKLAVTEITK